VTTVPGTGFCIWLTGLSGSGKTTTAVAISQALVTHGRQVTLLDGDEVRRTESPSLGYSRAERGLHVRRIGAMARDAVLRGEVAVCAVVSPFIADREACRALIGAERFLEVFVNAPLAICEERDPKGLYGRARRREISEMCGIDLPYEPPSSPQLVLDTVSSSVAGNVERIVDCLIQHQMLAGAPQGR
jgi:adenylyl-sulfate kinase